MSTSVKKLCNRFWGVVQMRGIRDLGKKHEHFGKETVSHWSHTEADDWIC